MLNRSVLNSRNAKRATVAATILAGAGGFALLRAAMACGQATSSYVAGFCYSHGGIQSGSCYVTNYSASAACRSQGWVYCLANGTCNYVS